MSNQPDPKRRALGRGLESLLPQKSAPVALAAAPAPEPVSDGKPLELALELIDRNPYQTRMRFDEELLNELAASIGASGVVQPIVVRPGKDGRYTLITGERRVLASRKAGKATIPAVVREVSNLQAMEMTIIENLQRADLNPIEQAFAYQRLSQEFQLTQEQMAIRTGKDRASVTNFLRLLKLPDAVQEYVASGALSFGHARALLALDSPEAITKVAEKILAQHLSVRATENFIYSTINPETKPKPVAPVVKADPNVREAEDKLRRSLGLKVTIEDKMGKGRVIIEYSGIEDFDTLLTALGGSSAL